jgi:CheY-like chemotaxis protein
MKLHVYQRRNVLLIDDDEDDCLLLKLALAKVSDQVTLVCLSCADRLWEALGDYKPGLIIIDMHLPKRNGIEILRLIKEQPCYKDIPVIIWSTSSMANNVIAAYSTGAQLYLEKPFDYKALAATLQKIIEDDIHLKKVKLSNSYCYDAA